MIQFVYSKNARLGVRFDLNPPSVQKVKHSQRQADSTSVITFDLISIPLYMVGKLARIISLYRTGSVTVFPQNSIWLMAGFITAFNWRTRILMSYPHIHIFPCSSHNTLKKFKAALTIACLKSRWYSWCRCFLRVPSSFFRLGGLAEKMHAHQRSPIYFYLMQFSCKSQLFGGLHQILVITVPYVSGLSSVLVLCGNFFLIFV